MQNGLTATRHGNGRDWWILIPTYKIGSFYKILLHPEGLTIIAPPVSTTFDQLHTPTVAISPDGSKLFYHRHYPLTGNHDIYFYSFNRCDASIQELHHSRFQDNSFGQGACFSPDSRFLYFNSEKYIYQFKIESLTNECSQSLIATYDGFISGLNYTFFSVSRLGPDDKIYFTGGHSNTFHLIENPNVEGIGCNVLQHAIVTPYNNLSSIPNMPNFRLKNWVGSPCDYLTSTAEIKPELVSLKLKASPNPANTMVKLLVEALQRNTAANIQVFDQLGRKVMALPVLPGQSVVNYDVRNLPVGMYTAMLQQGDRLPGLVRFVVNH